ncbi:sodium ion-translocating decarboxylase subunit beta [Desulfatiglans anilini]|uniref:sodium ion-translocating decarboxylase subunit beta n=1 Tax=Desulfatiglans anilini TaxID=90728 RepID=UPI000421FFE7|nr:sodium ion-translocating decarboxylase subunit beta [Desulfatiglans anilini]
MSFMEVIEMLQGILTTTGIMQITWQHVLMWIIGCAFLFMAIVKKFEPLLLLPIGFGIFVVNFPLVPLMGYSDGHGQLFRVFYHYGLEWEIIPCVIFLGLGAMTDFGPLIANPKTLLIGAGAQLGVFVTFTGTVLAGFTLKEAASVSIIGGADGPTTIYLTQHLAPQLLGANAVAAYSYMAMVPLIQPPIMRFLTTPNERTIRMKQLRPVSKQEKIIYPLICTIIIALLVPAVMPLMGMFMLGNLMRESGVVARLSDTAQNALMNIVTIFLGISVGATMEGSHFLSWKPLFIFGLGLIDFAVCTAGGIVTVKIMNLFLKEKINPLIGSAGVSAVPMSARVSQIVGQEFDKRNYLLMHAMGPNLAGVIGTAAAAGMFIAMFD